MINTVGQKLAISSQEIFFLCIKYYLFQLFHARSRVRRMHLYFLLLLSFPLLVLSIPHWCRHPLAHSNHTPRPAHHPNSCQFGSGPGPCGGDVCLKGPGDVCGGARDRYGKCAEGLLCSNCNRSDQTDLYKLIDNVCLILRCQGCSLTSFTCWYDDHCRW